MVYGRPSKMQNILAANPEFSIRKITVGNASADKYTTGGIAINLGGRVVHADGISTKGHIWIYDISTNKFKIYQTGGTTGELSNNSTAIRQSEVWIKVWRRTK